MQRLQHISMTDSIRNFMYTKHKRSNAKLRILSFIPQKQHTHNSILWLITEQLSQKTSTKETTNRTSRTTTGSSNKNFIFLQLRHYSGVFIFRLRNKPTTQKN